MSIFKRTASLLAALLLLAMPQTGSITVRMSHGGQAVPGGTITLHRVADAGDHGRYIPVPEFADGIIDLNGPLSPADAQALADHAGEMSIPGQTEALGENGTAVFAPLEPGLYLLVQAEAGRGYLPVRPFFISVPQQISGELRYQVDAGPKCAPEPQDPQSPQIPQTGQLRWPVPVMMVLGIFLMMAGLLLYRKGGHNA